MLLKHRPPAISTAPVQRRQGLEHLETSWIEVLRWLNAIKLDYVVVGPVAHAIRGDVSARGPVAIVLAPYGRNFERLASALIAQHAGLRSDRGLPGGTGTTVPVKLTGDKLARGRRWMLRFGSYDLDVEGAGKRAAGAVGASASADASVHAPRYQELLYESGRFELAEGLGVEVASPEDLEHFSHVRRTGSAPEFRITRTAAAAPDPADTDPATDPGGAADASAEPPAADADAGGVAEGREAGDRPPGDASADA